MDIFEKQQRIESINGIIKARWLFGSVIVVLGLVLKARFFGWGAGFGETIVSAYLKIGAFGVVAFGYNFIFWLLMRRITNQPLEKANDRFLKIMSILQIVPDQLMFTLVLHDTGSFDSMGFMFYFISVFLASSLYKNRGIILTGALAGFLFTTLLIAEHQGIIPHYTTYQGTTFFDNPYALRGKITTFIFYIGTMTFVAAFISNLIRNREKKLREQRDKLSQQTHVLVVQTHELTQAQDQLQGALTRSDISRKAATQARDEMEKANLELKKKIDELEKFYNITIGREVRMAELKKENKELKEKYEKRK